MSAAPDKRVDRLESAELARRIAAIADAKQADDLVALDMRDLVGYTDFLVDLHGAQRAPGEGDPRRGLPAAEARRRGCCPRTWRGRREARWVLIDYLDCVLHVFVPELRERYRLEVLWGEAPRLELELEELRDSA